ncbi:MAG: hypothetical protein K8R21_01205 [Leptospira sp.]|nr:hypothetical protein [Leptospira sp.]
MTETKQIIQESFQKSNIKKIDDIPEKPKTPPPSQGEQISKEIKPSTVTPKKKK